VLADARVVLAGAGAAGLGIARLLRLAGVESVALVDSKGLVHAGRADLDPWKAALAVVAPDGDGTRDLVATIAACRPNVLVGATGVAGTFSEAVVTAMDERLGPTERPVILPLSNPTAACEATPADVLAWTGGRALVATGSPFEPVELDGRTHVIGQANNAFIFPGVGLGAIVAEAATVTDRMFLLAAHALAEAVTDDRLATGALYPPVSALRDVSRRIAVVVAREAGGLDDVEAAVDAAMWWPAYVPYLPAREGERRRAGEA
jgi:malic enzyme